jgi:hypothetical protein
MKRRIGIALALAITMSTTIAFTMESEKYLGNKLRRVVEGVDNSYVEKNKKQLVERHRKAFAELGEHLSKKYPNISLDLNAWIESHYGQELDGMSRDEKDKRITLDALLVLDRQEPMFRCRYISYINEKYPGLFGETACFLRDNYPSALREVLRMTLRMTSHVTPCAYVSPEGSGPDVSENEVRRGEMPEGRP